MNIYISASISIIKHQYVSRNSSCNLRDNAILISRLARWLKGDNHQVFKRWNRSYRSGDTMRSFPEWCSWQYILVVDLNERHLLCSRVVAELQRY
jgi:hypothetical protein